MKVFPDMSIASQIYQYMFVYSQRDQQMSQTFFTLVILKIVLVQNLQSEPIELY